MTRSSQFSSRTPQSKKPALLLLLIAAVLFALPPSITGHAAGLLQVLAPLQNAVGGATDVAESLVRGESPSDDARRDHAGLQSLIATLATQNEALRQENERLTRVRERGLGVRGRLIPAHVIAEDSLPWRVSKTLLAGTQRGVRRGDAVISEYFSIDLAVPDAVDAGMAVLSAETLVGVVEQVSPFASRVRLLGDPATRMPVSIGRVAEGRVAVMEESFWLVGRGRGRIEIRDVHHQYVRDGEIQIGDVVLTQPDDPRLPPSINIGTVTTMTPDPDNGLLYILTVDPGLDAGDLNRVYVVDVQS